jgi:hypothetical protein
MGTEYFPGVKRPERGVDHSFPSSAEVKARVELYLYSPSGAFVACSRAKFTVTFIVTFFSAKTHYLSTDCLYLLFNVDTVLTH